MALTPEQQAQLEALQEAAAAPDPRTTSGLAGVLHTLADVASGAVAGLGGDVWAGIHAEIEKALGAPAPADTPAPAPDPGGGTEGAGFAG